MPMEFLELNTMHNPVRGMMDEDEREWCPKCGNCFSLANRKTAAITSMHMKLCEVDAAVALMKVEQQYKEWFCR